MHMHVNIMYLRQINHYTLIEQSLSLYIIYKYTFIKNSAYFFNYSGNWEI